MDVLYLYAVREDIGCNEKATENVIHEYIDSSISDEDTQMPHCNRYWKILESCQFN